MRKRLLVVAVALAALTALASPAFGKDAAPKSIHKAAKSSARVLTMKNVAAAHPEVPAANWSIGGSMVTPVGENGGGAFAANRVFVPGGFDSTGAVFGQMQIYSPNANTWSQDPDLLSNLTGLPGVADAAVCADNTGKIHVIDGTLDGLSIFASHLVYTPNAPAGSKWSALAIPNTVADGNYYSQDAGCSFIGGKLYLYGGYGVTDTGCCTVAGVQKITWVYDPATDTWTDTGRHMATGRIWQGYTNNATRVFACGGSDNVSTFAPIAKCETFTATAGWKPMATLPAARLAPGMGFLGSTLTTFGGGDSTFTPLASTVGCVGSACGPGPWADLVKNLNTPRWFHAFASGGGKDFAAGGFNSAGATLGSTEFTT